MRYFVSAGEASGDLHASGVIAELAKLDSDAVFTFLGGDFMAAAAGVKPLVDYRDMAYMGFSEVLRHLPDVARNLKLAKEAIANERPDAVILVDYPDFNMKLAKHAHSLGIPVYYYISPKVWAWKAWRVRDMKRYIRRILSILPFEEEFFAPRGCDAVYVGNPSVEEIDRRLGALTDPRKAVEAQIGADPRPLLAIVAGSRMGEIRNNLPIMDAVAARHKDMRAVIAGAPGIDPEVYSRYSKLPVVQGVTFELMAAAQAALVTSGTASLECALANTPQVVCYRANGSRLAYKLFERILKVPFVSLPNLIAGREIVTESLLHRCTPELVDRALTAILPGSPGREAQLEGYAAMRSRLGTSAAAATAAAAIVADLRG